MPEPSRRNASRFAWRSFRRIGYGFKVPISTLPFETGDGDETLEIEYANPVDTARVLMKKAPGLLVGGFRDAGDRGVMLQSFWEAYRQNHPSHPVFVEHAGSLNRVVPISWHGDEGRGKRRGNTIVISWEATIGIETEHHIKKGNKFCTNCALDQRVESFFQARAGNNQELCASVTAQRTTMRGHSYLQHWPIFVLPGAYYKTYSNLTFLAWGVSS